MENIRLYTLTKDKMFSKIDKLSIYKETLRRLILNDDVGICSNMRLSMLLIFNESPNWFLDQRILNPIDYPVKYEELYIHSPYGKYVGETYYWFPLNEDGQNKRIKIVNKVINHLENDIIRDYLNVIT